MTIAIVRYFLTIWALSLQASGTVVAQWVQLPGPSGQQISSLVESSGVILAAALDSTLLRSTDGGLTWRRSVTGLPDSVTIRHLGVHDQYIYSVVNFRGIYRSSDQGVTWSLFNNGLPTKFANKLYSIDGEMYLTTGAGLYMLADTAWRLVSNDLAGRSVGSMCKSGQRMIAGSNSIFLFKSSDGGATWDSDSTGFFPSVFLSLFCHDEVILAGVQLAGIYRSTDYGETWSQVSAGVRTSESVRSIVGINDVLFAGLTDGMLRSTDKGASWSNVGVGFPSSVNIQVFDIRVIGDHAYIGSSQWIWRRPLNELLPAFDVSRDAQPEDTYLSEAMPNPATKLAEVTYRMPTAGPVELKLYTYSGHKVATLVDESKEAGSYSTYLDVSNLPSGIYYYRLTVGSTSLTRRLVVVK